MVWQSETSETRKSNKVAFVVFGTIAICFAIAAVWLGISASRKIEASHSDSMVRSYMLGIEEWQKVAAIPPFPASPRNGGRVVLTDSDYDLFTKLVMKAMPLDPSPDYPSTGVLTDRWGRRLRVTLIETDGQLQPLEVRSAGPDGAYGTSDDIVHTRESARE